MRPRTAWLIPGGLYALPLVASVAWAVAGGLDTGGWTALSADAALGPALALSLWVGACSTAASLALALVIVTRLHGTRVWQRLQAALGGLLALPHAAFAVGLALLLMPSGLIARLLAPLVGWDAPPDVATVQDPAGLALISGLVLKETPFLLWTIAAQLQRAGLGAQLQRQLHSAQTMGYAASTVWWRVLWPQLLPRLALPLLAVWAYGLTVVDMALVLGPTRPPTLAVLAWEWLRDADVALNRQGAAAALLLTAAMAGGALLAVLVSRLLRPWRHARQVRGDRPAARLGGTAAIGLVAAGGVVYGLVAALLVFVSFAGVWTFPALWPQVPSADAWLAVFGSARELGVVALTAGLGLLAAATGLLLAVAWMETTPLHWDDRAAPLVLAPLLLPGVLFVAGLYRVTLVLGIDGSRVGLWLAHSLYTVPYALIALAPAYRGFDVRYEQTARALGRSRAAFLWRIKWPMLAAPLAAAFAIAFAVSVTQYLSTQFVGAGRHATLTTEALTLASGGQRPAMAAFALLQALLPAAVFAGAAWLAARRARRTQAQGH
jgi:putative thiamine transport system permease protein